MRLRLKYEFLRCLCHWESTCLEMRVFYAATYARLQGPPAQTIIAALYEALLTSPHILVHGYGAGTHVMHRANKRLNQSVPSQRPP